MTNKIVMKYILIIIIIFLVLLIYCNKSRKPNVLKSVTSYRIFYRKINQNILEGMKKYDLNIVEGTFFTSDDVKYLQDNNTKVVGYYSIMEIGSWDNLLIDKLDDNDYLRINGSKVMNVNKTNYIGDISKEHYQDCLIELIGKRIIAKKMDGIFLDTIDWIDYYQDNKFIYGLLIDGYQKFLKKIKETYPDIVIIQNRGFKSYQRISKKYIDGILWENFLSPYSVNNQDKIKAFESFVKVSRRYNTVVFTISFDENENGLKLSNNLGWVHSQSQMKNRYSKWDIRYETEEK